MVRLKIEVNDAPSAHPHAGESRWPFHIHSLVLAQIALPRARPAAINSIGLMRDCPGRLFMTERASRFSVLLLRQRLTTNGSHHITHTTHTTLASLLFLLHNYTAMPFASKTLTCSSLQLSKGQKSEESFWIHMNKTKHPLTLASVFSVCR